MPPISSLLAKQSATPEAVDVPLCVDMDGTLIRSDMLFEGLLRCLKRNPLYAFAAIWWLFRGKARLKAEIARRASIDVARLPVNDEFLAWLTQENARGRPLVLCTAADRVAAHQVAERFGIFAEVLASEPPTNLSGRAKADLLEQKYGRSGFDYAGNELRDWPIWEAARSAIVVEPTRSLHRVLDRVPRVIRTFRRSEESAFALWVKALRLHQWAKNLLIFVPAVAAHEVLNPSIIVLAFLWFGLCASATYVVNDLLDLDADRAHSQKHRRPFASGRLTLLEGIIGSVLLLGVGFAGAAVTIGPLFVGALGIYLVGTLWYSFVLKKIAMVDTLALAGLYTLRIIAGSVAATVVPSFWLLAFSMFVFLSLAMVKRYTELRSARSSGLLAASGRGYTTEDLPLILACGVSAGYIAVLVMALYVNIGAPVLYGRPEALWLVCPLILYWVCRVWRKAHRDELHDDPVVFAIKDWPSLTVAALCAVLMWAAT